ncbi:MAG: polyphosphate kinase 1 [Microthrixaceae bacterium]
MSADPTRFVNRELSWLDFDERVLALAEDPSTPALERAKFLAIFSGNLDEFYQVRVAGLYDQIASGVADQSPDGLTPAQQLDLVTRQVNVLTSRAARIFERQVKPSLAAAGLEFATWDQLDEGERAELTDVFNRRIFPLLTPLAVDPAHPFPEISNLSLNLAVLVNSPDDPTRRFARLKLPPSLPRYLVTTRRRRLVALEHLVAAQLGRLFIGFDIGECAVFRVTRNADLDLEEGEAEDLLEAVEVEVRRRRFGTPVRLEVPDTMSEEVVDLLERELDLEPGLVQRSAAPVDLGGLWSLYTLDVADLKFPTLAQSDTRGFQSATNSASSVFATLRRGDVLVQHPYDNFSSSVEEFIRQASVDRRVRAIKITLYRTTGDGVIVSSLIRAAEAGIQVVALVELQARFDETNNIAWARDLEHAGVHVVYGVVGLKTHTKIAIISRSEGGEVRSYCHIGTGNYHPRTARTYEDIGLFTSDPAVAADVHHLFNFLTGYSRGVEYQRLIVAPDHMRTEIAALIANERPEPVGTTPRGEGHIVMKLNNLVDPRLIDDLYAAAGDGVRIDLIVRGICCLRPQVPGLSETVTVRSIVGRYLEHSRIYRFAHGGPRGGVLVAVGSADLMPRNLDRRVEALVKITNDALIGRLDGIVEALHRDNVRAWTLEDRTWHKVPTPDAPPEAGDLDADVATWTGEGPGPHPDRPFEAHIELHRATVPTRPGSPL